MEFTGEFINASKDWQSGKWLITFSCDQNSALYQVDKVKDKKLHIEAKRNYNPKSKNANGYAWALMQKIAEAINSDKWSVYVEMLQRYSRVFSLVMVEPGQVAKHRDNYRTFVELGDIEVNGETWTQLLVFFGSHTFDSKDMSVFIDGLVSECKELGIETIPPEELERMKNEWTPREAQ